MAQAWNGTAYVLADFACYNVGSSKHLMKHLMDPRILPSAEEGLGTLLAAGPIETEICMWADTDLRVG